MLNRLKWVLIGALVLFVAGTIGISIFYVKQKPAPVMEKPEASKEEPKKEMPKEPAPTELEEVDVSDWKTYTNEEYGFEVKYPKDSKVGKVGKSIVIDLPLTPGTNLTGKYLKIFIDNKNREECSDPAPEYTRAPGTLEELKSERVIFNKVVFYKKEVGDCGMGSCIITQYFSTYHNDYCFHLTFELYYSGVIYTPDYKGPLKEFDEIKEKETFNKMLSTFRFFK
ncbi:hypothetical protein D6D85_04675 [Candidatus Methanodesulfokora washburnensis]|jgi:hypothetical protein|uniref:Uncharacterized protein n=2 Tax=Candidatus Methanodesulfokora washburnensis TaxID=2478471 RepID=A0A3R9PH23_9CREN|nr:hypothetical protein D6D85_04675 [Candidatus Methanodesulfokores washburnensis]